MGIDLTQYPNMRTLTSEDRGEFGFLLHESFNTWYRTHGLNDQYFSCSPSELEIIYEIYDDLDPDCNVVAVDDKTGRIMGVCFYHPRTHHVSLGIMSVHPGYWNRGVGKTLYQHIINFTDRNQFPSLRICQSACNVDSFSLYSQGGSYARYGYHDMILQVPSSGLKISVPGMERVRDPKADDILAMGELEMAVSGILREKDYRYCMENRLGFWHVSVLEGESGGLDGFMISCGHPSFNMLGPCVARTEEDAIALILNELNFFQGRSPIFLIPMEKQKLVRQMYALGAKNIEMHFYQVRGQFQEVKGVSMPTFLPETG